MPNKKTNRNRTKARKVRQRIKPAVQPKPITGPITRLPSGCAAVIAAFAARLKL